MIPVRRLVSAGMVLSLTLLVGRLAGFVREMQLGAVFGVSRDGDFAVVMLTTPDLLVNLLLAGGLSAALVPEFGRLDKGGRTRVFWVANLLVAGLFGAIGLVLAIFPSILLFAFAPGYVAAPAADYARAFTLAALATPLAGLTGVTAALLNSEQKFFIAGAGTLVFNVTIIIALLMWPASASALIVLGLAIVAAALLRYGSQLIASVPFLQLSAPTNHTIDFHRLALRFVQALSASTLVLLVPVILRALVSLSGEGNIAAYNFSSKLVELPLGIAITTVSAVAFPAMSKAVAVGDENQIAQHFESGVRRGLGLSLCIAVPSLWFSLPLVELVFGRGRMDAADLLLISDLARLGFLTLPFIAISSMATALLNARGETGRLLKMTLGCAIVVPIAALPGIIFENVRFTIAALPVFHLVYALILLYAVRQPVFKSWTWTWKSLLRPGLVALVATALCALLLHFVGLQSALAASAFALAAIALSMLGAGGIEFRRHRTPS